MSSGRFAALNDANSTSSSSASSEHSQNERSLNLETSKESKVNVPSYEDLSTSRLDEETVLSAVYGPDFTREEGAWGSPKLLVRVRPPDTEKECIGCSMTLSVQLPKKYPYVVPKVEFLDSQGLSKEQHASLLKRINERANELAASGTVMVIEFVQLVEDFLLENNQDPTKSAWEQMKDRQAKEKEERERLEREWMAASNTNEANSNLTKPAQPGEDFSNSSSSVARYQLGLSTQGEVERELARQRAAIDAARKVRLQGGLGSHGIMERISSAGDGDAEEDEDDFDYSERESDAAPIGLAGRYYTDFIELGVLGRGGGGEVVKVRNRLDRRICRFSLVYCQCIATRRFSHPKYCLNLARCYQENYPRV